MAMTKKEKEAMQAAIDKADLIVALRWTAPVGKDVKPPDREGYSEGWTYNAYSKVVEIAWSTSVAHGKGPIPKSGVYQSGSQRSLSMYSTKSKALAAMRYEIETESARHLMAIDRRLRKLTEAE